MSSIQKMTIQGIRSYGPKDQDTQVIEFFSPVTLIVGQNGSGKTTIIECLKYSTTGDMPPNTKGASFVFDPKLIDEVETKGRIKLYFKDTSGLNVQLQKNLCSTQKLKKLEFRTVETIISRYNQDNKLISTITSKCINADNEIINAFGVTKAVLEHVIFCHQEDSNWPLSDGKLLKTRFDEIFSATKYIKTLDVLRKIRLEKQQSIKQIEIEKKHLETYKQRSDQLKRDLDESTLRKEQLEQKKKNLLEKLAPIDEKLEFFFRESQRLFEIKGVIDKIESEKALLEKQIKELLLTINDCVFQGTDLQLKEQIENFNRKTDQMRQDDQEEIYKQINLLQQKQKELNEKKSKLCGEQGALETQRKIYQSNKQQLIELNAKACKLMEEEVEDSLISEMLRNFIENVSNRVKAIEEKQKNTEKSYQERIDSERDQKSKLDQNISNKNDLIEKYETQLHTLTNDLRTIGNDRIQTSLIETIANLKNELDKESKQLKDVNELNKDINKLENEKLNLKKKETLLNAKLNKLHANSKRQCELDLLNKDRQQKQEQIRKIKLRVRHDIDKFFEKSMADSSDLNLKLQFESECRDLAKNISAYEMKQKEAEKRLCASEIKRKNDFELIRAKEKEMRECEDKLMSELQDVIKDDGDLERFDEILKDLKETQVKLMDERGYLNGVDKTYKKFLRQLKQDTSRHSKNDDFHSCPVCMRLFKDQDELDETIVELNKATQRLPGQINELEIKLTETETSLNKMINMKSTKEKYEKLKQEEIAKLRVQLEKQDKQELPKLKQELKEINEVLVQQLYERKQLSDQLQNEIVLVDKYARECDELDKKLQLNESSMLIDLDDDQDDLDQLLQSNEETNKENKVKYNSVEKLNELKKELENELELISKSITSKSNEKNENYKRVDKMNTLKEEINNKNAQLNELQMKSQKKSQLLDKQNELKVECENCKSEVEVLETKLADTQTRINQLLKERQEKSRQNEQSLSKESSLLNEAVQCQKKIDECSEQVNNFEQNGQLTLNNLIKEIKSIENESKKISYELEEERGKLDEIKSELARFEIKQRQFMDNLRLREKRIEYKNVNERLEKKKSELNLNDKDLDLKSFKDEQKKYERMKDELNKDLTDIKTKLNILDGKLQTINDELKIPNYNSALDNYIACAADLRVLELAVNDIDKYYKALDRAIMNYHMLKMNEINKTIKQLWRQVYRGNDIDYVEIRSEEDGASEAGDYEIKARRTYNYRVVLIKGDTQLDMRGRCSAGQKVLASIIIRLALAETFCLNSGILALDEPTTNLDRENIESLASALVDIIKSRSKQKNFQILIITHDEDFVEMLGRSEYMDQFYRVEKDENGFSKISRRSNFSL